MSNKVIPWRRKPKIRSLEAGIDTSMSFAVVGSPEKFKQEKRHAFKVLRLLHDLGAEVYPVASNLEKLGKEKVWPKLDSLPKAVEVVIPCLPAEYSLSIVVEAKEAGIPLVWFQPRTLSSEAYGFCQDNGLEVVESCALKHREFSGVSKFLHPCFWHSKTISRKQNKL